MIFTPSSSEILTPGSLDPKFLKYYFEKCQSRATFRKIFVKMYSKEGYNIWGRGHKGALPLLGFQKIGNWSFLRQSANFHFLTYMNFQKSRNTWKNCHSSKIVTPNFSGSHYQKIPIKNFSTRHKKSLPHLSKISYGNTGNTCCLGLYHCVRKVNNWLSSACSIAR